ncbi:MAG TPA: hypothetical protein VK023_05270 [Sphingobacterium bovisgrunnientis]|nr:hypothetical protein [Sphingobacterium bovisgrunnientis]
MRTEILFISERAMMVLFNRLYLFSYLLSFLFLGCKTEYIKLVPEVQNEEIQLVRDNKITLQYNLSELGYSESGVKYFEKENPNNSQTVKAIRKGENFYVELVNLTAKTTYKLQVYYIFEGQTLVSENLLEVTTTSKFPNNFTIDLKDTEINYGDLGEFSFTIEGDNLHNINLKDLQIYLNRTMYISSSKLQMSYPEKLANGKYCIKVSGYYEQGWDNQETILITFKQQPILVKSVNFKYKGQLWELQATRTNILSRYFVSYQDQFYNFNGQHVSKFDELSNSFENIANIHYSIGVLSDKSVVVGDKIFFINMPYSNEGNEIYSQSFDFKRQEFKVYYYGKHNWFTAHEYEHSDVFVHNGIVYQAYTIKDFVNGMPTMPVPKVVNYVARYNAYQDNFEDFTTFDNTVSLFKFISFKGELYAFGMADVEVQGYAIGKTLAVYKVNPANFELNEIIRIGDEYAPYPISVRQLLEYDGKILLTFGPNSHVFYNPTTHSFQKIFMRNMLNYIRFHDIIKHKGKYYLFADHNSTSGSVYEITIKKPN